MPLCRQPPAAERFQEYWCETLLFVSHVSRGMFFLLRYQTTFFFPLLFTVASITPLYWFRGLWSGALVPKHSGHTGLLSPTCCCSVFSSQTASSGTLISVLHFWNAELLADYFIFALISSYCLGYLGPGINVKHNISISLWKYEETDYCMDFIGV